MDTAHSVVEFVKLILSLQTNLNSHYAYRGHSSADYKLQAAIFRKGSDLEREHLLLRELIVAHPSEFDHDRSTLEQLVRMQHHTLPTRLLDVTWNPLVALYFAAQRNERLVSREGANGTRRIKAADGEVIVLRVRPNLVKYFDSDTVSCIANLAKLTWEQKQGINYDRSHDEFNEQRPIKRLLHFVRQEKFAYDRDINAQDLKRIVLVKAKLNNRRILAQDGAFILFGDVTEIGDDPELGIAITRIRVPARSKAKLLQELDKLAVNQRSLFPDIEKAAQYLVQKSIVSTTPPPLARAVLRDRLA